MCILVLGFTLLCTFPCIPGFSPSLLTMSHLLCHQTVLWKEACLTLRTQWALHPEDWRQSCWPPLLPSSSALWGAPGVWDAQSVPPSFSHSAFVPSGHNLTCLHQYLQAKWSGATEWVLLWYLEAASTWTLPGNITFIFRTLPSW